ncbi:cytochrome B6, partial [Francisella tularensis subsp. holarctica]|nr:cytochrome B6 [Francisella tularensis subsp. holarctica]
MNSSLTKGYAKIVLALLFWASLYHIAPLPLSYFDIYLVGFIRYAFASWIFIVVNYYFTKTFFPRLNLK